MPSHVRATRIVRRPGAQRGLSLVEILVAVVISLILLGGMIQLFVSNKQSYRIQESVSRLQQNGRFAMDMLGTAIRMADHWGGIEADAVDVGGGTTYSSAGDVGSDCDDAWVNDVQEGIRGWEGSDGSPATAPFACVNDADYVSASDMLVVRYADGQPIDAASPSTSTIYVRSAIGELGELHSGGNPPGGILSPAAASTNNVTNVFQYPYRIELYFLRPCSIKGGTYCAASDDGGDPVPTLTRVTLDDTGQLVQEPLIEGVEQLQFEYGVDTDNDETVDRFQTADAVTDWQQVVTVRMSLLLRGDELDIAVTDNSTYQMAGGFSYTPPSGQQNSYQRKLFTEILQIRNRVRQ